MIMSLLVDREANEMDKEIEDQSKIDTKVLYSKLYTNSFYMAADTINTLHGHGRTLDLVTLTEALMDGTKKITDGHTKEIEQILMMQAKTLDYVFYDALKKLVGINMINQIEVFTNIALKAQTQCRKTLAVLAELKHPRRTATFIAQQNNALNQQVNNAVKADVEQFENSGKVANELIAEVTHGTKTMDIRTTVEAIPSHISPKAVGTFNRAQNK